MWHGGLRGTVLMALARLLQGCATVYGDGLAGYEGVAFY